MSVKVIETEVDMSEFVKPDEMEYKATLTGPCFGSGGGHKHYFLNIKVEFKQDDEYTQDCPEYNFSLQYYKVWEVCVDGEFQTFFELTNPDIKTVLPTLLMHIKKKLGTIIREYRNKQKIIGELVNSVELIEFIDPCEEPNKNYRPENEEDEEVYN